MESPLIDINEYRVFLLALPGGILGRLALGCALQTRHAVYMIGHRRLVKLKVPACLLACGAMLLPRFAHTQEAPHDVPAHAHYSAAEQGWTCNDGFRQLGASCVKDNADVQSQGPFEFFDGQWRCRSGYQREGRFCVTVTAPAHATLVEPGGRWECDWGYRRVASRCEEIKPPLHAYLDASGQDWACYPGFQRNADGCTAAESAAPAEPADSPARP
jgi:hypothetical protein